MNLVTLIGGGADYVCNRCLDEARAERVNALVGITGIWDPHACCVYCGVTQAEIDAGPADVAQ